MEHPEPASTDDAARFNDSLERCTATPAFLDDFYRRFLASSDEVARKFEGVDLQHQARMLRVSLYLAMYASWGRDEFNYHLDRIAERHSRRDLDVAPHLYDLWLDCLVEAVAEHDPRFAPDVAEAWRAVLAPGIAHMKERY